MSIRSYLAWPEQKEQSKLVEIGSQFQGSQHPSNCDRSKVGAFEKGY